MRQVWPHVIKGGQLSFIVKSLERVCCLYAPDLGEIWLFLAWPELKEQKTKLFITCRILFCNKPRDNLLLFSFISFWIWDFQLLVEYKHLNSRVIHRERRVMFSGENNPQFQRECDWNGVKFKWYSSNEVYLMH